MPIPLLVKAGAVGLGLFGVWSLFGDDAPTTTERPPYTQPVPLPGTPALPWDPTVDAALCLAFDSVGAADAAALLNDLARRLYPDVPSWPPVGADHPTVRQAYTALGTRVSVFVNMVKNGQTVCQGAPPPEPEGEDEVDIEALFTGKPGGFALIAAGSNPTSVIASAYGIPAAQTGKIRNALGCVATVGYNMVFVGRKQPGDDYGRGKVDGAWYDANWAFLPRNDDPRIAAAEGRKMTRWIGWTTGNAVDGNPGRYFPLWLPPMLAVANTLTCSNATDAFHPSRNPPASVLAKVGWTLDELHTVYKQSPIAGPEA